MLIASTHMINPKLQLSCSLLFTPTNIKNKCMSNSKVLSIVHAVITKINLFLNTFLKRTLKISILRLSIASPITPLSSQMACIDDRMKLSIIKVILLKDPKAEMSKKP